MKTKPPLIALAISCVMLGCGGLRADVSLSVSTDIRIGKAPPPPPPVIEVVDAPQPKGPPPWAPAHGFRRNHTYYFYPGCDIYYRPDDRMWFFLEGGSWKVGLQLPSSIEVDFSRSVLLSMEADQPFIHHSAVVVHYPKDYFSHVKIKEGRADGGKKEKVKAEKEKRKKADSDDAKSDASQEERGNGQGKGKGHGKNK